MIEFKGNIAEMPVGYPVIGVDSTQFSIGDAVYIDSNGYLALATTSSKILGYCIEDKTTSSTNATVEYYCPQYVYGEDVEILIDSDQAATQTDIGAYADLASATTGAMTLNLAAGSTGQFFVLGWDTDTPNTSKVVCTIAEPQKFAFAQS